MNKFLRVFFTSLTMLTSCVLAQGFGGGGGSPPSGDGPGGGGGPGKGKTLTPEQSAKQEISKLEKIVSLRSSQRDSLLKIFQYYYDDLVFYEGKTTPRLLESLAKGRDQKVCKILDSLACTNYMDSQHKGPRSGGPSGPPPDGKEPPALEGKERP